MPEAALRAPRTWPERFPPLADERIELACRGCGQDWHVHYDLAGFRLRCACGGWLAVPPDPRVPASLRAAALARLPRPPARPAALPASRVDPPARPTAEPAAPRRPRARRRGWQLAGLALLLAAPAPALALATPAAPPIALPLVSLFVGLVALAAGALSERSSAAALRGSAPRFVAEGLAAAFAAAALFVGWTRWSGADPSLLPTVALRESLGYAPALLLAALLPAVFQELAFRGVAQGRAARLVGRRGGALLGAALFALVQAYVPLAPGLAPMLALTALLGLHLGSLRARSQSLLPCVVEHFLFAALLVVLL